MSFTLVPLFHLLCTRPPPPPPPLSNWHSPTCRHGTTRMMGAFADVRSQVEAGLLAYPYTTRELVNVARHLQSYPQDR